MSDTKVKITAETAEAERALGALGREVIGLSGKMGSLTGVAGALGGAFSISAFAGFIKGSIDAADHLKDLSKTLSLPVEQLAGISLAAKQSGSDLDGTAKSISKLAENMGKDSEKFAKLGITAKDPVEAFKQLADVYNAIQDPQKKAAFGAEALGKSWKETAPLLAEGSQRIGEMISRGTALAGPIKEAAERADQFNDTLAELEAQASGAGISLANIALPALTKTATAMNDLAREGHPVLALWRGLAGMGQVAWDFLFPPENLIESMKSANRVKELKEELFDMERNLRTVKGGGMISRALYGEAGELEQQINITKNQIAAIEKHAAELDKKTPAAKKGTTPSGVDSFIGGDGADKAAAAQQAKNDAILAKEQDKYDKLREMALMADATDVERVQIKMDFDLQKLDEGYSASAAARGFDLASEESYLQARRDITAISESDIGKLKKKAAEQQAKEGRANSMQDLQTLGEKYRLFFELSKVGAIAEIAIAGGARAEKSAAWAATWGGPPAAALATGISWAATAANIAMVASQKFGGGISVSGAGGTPSVSSSSMTPSVPVSSQPSSSGVAAQASQNVSITIVGNEAMVFSYDQVVNHLIPAINEAAGNGVNITVNV